MAEIKLIFYAIFFGLLLFILSVFFNALGIAQIITILANLSLCILFYGIFKIVSNRISFRSKTREFYLSNNKKLGVSITEENNLRSKRVWHYDTIFLTKILLVIGFFVGIALKIILDRREIKFESKGAFLNIGGLLFFIIIYSIVIIIVIFVFPLL